MSDLSRKKEAILLNIEQRHQAGGLVRERTERN
jgi:hypothetical protein